MPNSPNLWGPNNTSIGLQNSVLRATGRTSSYDGAKNYVVNNGFERGDTTGWSLIRNGATSGVAPSQIAPPSIALTSNQVTFTCTSANATVGATYTNNAQTFTVLATIAAGTTLYCSGTGAPTASGTLTKSGGTGDATIAFNPSSTNTVQALTAVASSSSPLSGTYSVNLTSSGSSGGDCFLSDAFSIDKADQAKMLFGKIYYSISSGSPNMSGTLASNTFLIYVYDVTNGIWIQPQGVTNFIQSSGTGICTYSFQSASNAAQYQIGLSNNFGSTCVMQVDDFFLGPQTSPIAPVITDWVAYTPTFVGFGAGATVSGGGFFSRRVGDSLQVHGLFFSGTPTATPNQISLGFNGANGNVVTDTTKIIGNTKCGDAGVSANSTTIFRWQVLSSNAAPNNFIQLGVQTSTTNSNSGNINGNALSITNGVGVEVDFMVPIVGWSSNSSVSSDTDTRVVAARANNASATITSSYSDITWAAVINDTHGAMGAVNYTIPVSGYYDLTAQASLGGTQALNGTAAIQATKNGTIIQENDTGYGGTVTATNTLSIAVDAVLCNAGDTIKIQVKSSATLPVIADATNGCYFCIARRSGPAVINASESVNARYTNTAGTSIANSGADIVVPFATKDYDSHNAFVTDTYTIPVSGKYSISGTIWFSSQLYAANNVIYATIYKNGAVGQYGNTALIGGTPTGSVAVNVKGTLNLIAGDTIVIRASNNRTAGATTLATTANQNEFEIQRVGN